MKKKFLTILLLLILLLPLFFSLNSKVFAVTDATWESKINNPLLPYNWFKGTTFLQKFFNVFISLVFAVGGIIFFFMLVSGGIKWISSSGEKGKLEEAQKQITSALVGLVILLLAFAIIKLIESLFGISILNIKIPTLQ